MFNFDQFGNWVSSESSVTPQDSLHVSHGTTKRLGSMSRWNHSRDWWRALSYGPVTWPLIYITYIWDWFMSNEYTSMTNLFLPFHSNFQPMPKPISTSLSIVITTHEGPRLLWLPFFLPRTLNQIRLRSTLHVYYMWHAYYTYMHEWYPWCVFIHARMDVPLSPLCMLYAHDIWQNNLMNSCVHNVDMFIMLSLCCTVVWPFTTLSLSLVVQIGWYGFCFLDFMTYLRRSNTSNFQSNTLIWMMALTNSDWNNGPS